MSIFLSPCSCFGTWFRSSSIRPATTKTPNRARHTLINPVPPLRAVPTPSIYLRTPLSLPDNLPNNFDDRVAFSTTYLPSLLSSPPVNSDRYTCASKPKLKQFAVHSTPIPTHAKTLTVTTAGHYSGPLRIFEHAKAAAARQYPPAPALALALHGTTPFCIPHSKQPVAPQNQDLSFGMYQPEPAAYIPVSTGYGIGNGLPEFTFQETPLGLSSSGGTRGGGGGGGGSGGGYVGLGSSGTVVGADNGAGAAAAAAALLYTSPIFSASSAATIGPASGPAGPFQVPFHQNHHQQHQQQSHQSHHHNTYRPHQSSPYPRSKMDSFSDNLTAQEAAAREYQPSAKVRKLHITPPYFPQNIPPRQRPPPPWTIRRWL